MSDFGFFVQQGWQCPVCGAVYSPTTLACFNCTGWRISNTNKAITGDNDIETFRKFLNHSAIKPVEEEQDEPTLDDKTKGKGDKANGLGTIQKHDTPGACVPG